MAARPHYGDDLARIHHAHFGAVARAAADELLARLAAAGLTEGTVVDLAAGSGILAARVTQAGYGCVGVDISAAMIALARSTAPSATFVHSSLWSFALPRCVAVTAIGEAFGYAADPAAGLEALGERFRDVHAALDPGGLLLFDVAGPGRSGPSGVRRVSWERDGNRLDMQEHEEPGRLTRTIRIVTREGATLDEHHALCPYAPAEVRAALERAGLHAQPIRYGSLDLPAGWHAFAATKPP